MCQTKPDEQPWRRGGPERHTHEHTERNGATGEMGRGNQAEQLAALGRVMKRHVPFPATETWRRQHV